MESDSWSLYNNRRIMLNMLLLWNVNNNNNNNNNNICILSPSLSGSFRWIMRFLDESVD
jgi:hypothetical protein